MTAAQEKTVGNLKVEITAFGAWMVGVGSIIGSMAWLIHAPMLARAGTLASILAWIIAAIATVPLALILMELSSMFPNAGGPYVYKYSALKQLVPKHGELLGFLTGWLYWSALIAGLACIANGLVNLLSTEVFGSVSTSPIWFAPVAMVAVLGITTGLNYTSAGKASKINTIFCLVKFAMAIGFACLVASSGKAHLERLLQPVNPIGYGDLFSNVSSVLLMALTGFSFIESSGCISAETENARSSVPQAMILTLLTVSMFYLGMCAAVGSACDFTFNHDGVLNVAGTTFAATCPGVTSYLGGALAGHVFSFLVMASIAGCTFVALMGCARVSYSMAKTKLFPQQFAKLDEQTGVPHHALMFQFICVSVIAVAANLLSRSGVFADAYTFLCETFGFMYAFVAMLYPICLLTLRYKEPERVRLFRVGSKGNFLAWILSLITLGIWGFTAFLCTNWTVQVAGLIIFLCGIPIYSYYRADSILKLPFGFANRETALKQD